MPGEIVQEDGWLSRRNLLIGSGLASVLTAFEGLMPSLAQASISYRHPFNEAWSIPADGEWGNRAAWREYPPHAGVDYNVAGGSVGKAIRCVADGYVREVSWSSTYGNRIYVEHDDGMWSHYAHMRDQSPRSVGERVPKGAYLGPVGNTGSASRGAHLHLEMATSKARCNNGNTSIDPISFINSHLIGDELQADERAALFEIRDKLELIRAALLNGRPEYYGGKYSAFDVVLSHATQAKDTANQIKAKVDTL